MINFLMLTGRYHNYISSYFIYIIPAMLLSLFAQYKIQAVYREYLGRISSLGRSGAEVARAILDKNGLRNVNIKEVPGTLSDFYDPRDKSLSLSRDISAGTSIASVAVAAHEVGHAIQDKESYPMLNLRSFMAPAVRISSSLAMYLILAGLFFDFTRLFDIGIILYAVIVLFTLVTLPVEFNASRRALNEIRSMPGVNDETIYGSKKVLKAAALTYVASAFAALSELLRLLSMRRRDD